MATTTPPAAEQRHAALPSLSLMPSMERTMRFLETAFDSTTAQVGQTPKRIVWKQNKARLYRYLPRAERRHAVPLLIVHSLVSKSFILDLIPGNSFIEYLLDEGFDVYLTDWGEPGVEDSGLRIEDYVLGYIPEMVSTVCRESAVEEISMMGYCMGGVLSLLYAATHPDTPVRNLLSLATPVDFDHMGLQSIWGRGINVDRMVNTYGNIPAALIKNSFRMLKPASEVSPVKFIGLWQNLDNERFVEQFRAFDRWTQEHIDFPGEAFRQMLKDYVQENKLMRGGLTLDGRPVDLASIRQSFLAIAAESDHIVPLASTQMQTDLVASEDKLFMSLPGGHVGLVAGRGARKGLWPRLSGWLAERSVIAPAEVEYSLAAD